MIKKLIATILLVFLTCFINYAQDYFKIELDNIQNSKTYKVKADKRIGIQVKWDEYYKGRLLDIFNDSMLISTRKKGNLIFALNDIEELYIYKYHRYAWYAAEFLVYMVPLTILMYSLDDEDYWDYYFLFGPTYWLYDELFFDIKHYDKFDMRKYSIKKITE